MINPAERKGFFTSMIRVHRGMDNSERGSTMLEYALVLPFLTMLLGGIVDGSMYFYTSYVIQNAAREGARTAVTLRALSDNDTRVHDVVSAQLPPAGIITSEDSVEIGTEIDVISAGTLQEVVRVNVRAVYPFFLLKMFGLDERPIQRTSVMRYEWQ